ncbi:MAG TPA: rod shape-determining protein MreD [Bryobacteraceae bacterium]|nr:rod shape-determining protein MreD [Bryobacteraceae bacterium]
MDYSSGPLLVSQRERQSKKFRAWVLFAIPLAALLFQISVPRFFQFVGFLDMPLLVVVYFSLMWRNQLGGLAIGALMGLAQDSLSHDPLGMFGIDKTLVGYFAASVGVRLDVDNAVLRLLLTFFSYLFHQCLYWVMSHALLGRQMAFEGQRWLLLGLMNAVVGVSLYHFLDKLRESV